MKRFEKTERPTEESQVLDDEGRVKDQEIAREMADVEDKYRKRKLFGLLSPSEKKVKKGEHEAELRMKSILRNNLADKEYWEMFEAVAKRMGVRFADHRILSIKEIFDEINKEAARIGTDNLPPGVVIEANELYEAMENISEAKESIAGLNTNIDLDAVVEAAKQLLERLQKEERPTIH